MHELAYLNFNKKQKIQATALVARMDSLPEGVKSQLEQMQV